MTEGGAKRLQAPVLIVGRGLTGDCGDELLYQSRIRIDVKKYVARQPATYVFVGDRILRVEIALTPCEYRYKASDVVKSTAAMESCSRAGKTSIPRGTAPMHCRC